MIIFYRPEYLLLLFVIPVLIFIHIVSLRTSKRKAIKFANFDSIQRISGVELFSKNLTVLYINIFIILLLILCLSGISMTREVSASNIAFVVVIDNSRSMGADDISPNRIDGAKKAAIDFLNMLPTETKIGVISFSSNTVIEQELTNDKNLVKNAINRITLNPAGGTDALNALVAASNILADENAKTIVLMSDGGVNINSIQDIVDYTKKNRVIVHSLGIGTLKGGGDGTGAVYKIDEQSLRLIAESSGGRYYSIENLEDFYYSLSSLIEVTKKNSIADLSFYMLILTVILVLIDFYFINNRFRIFP